MAVTDWMRFQMAYGFGTVKAAKALEKWHSPAGLFSTEERLLRQPDGTQHLGGAGTAGRSDSKRSGCRH